MGLDYSTTQQLLGYGNDNFNLSFCAVSSTNQTPSTQVTIGFLDQIRAKLAAGFNISVTDLFAFVLTSEMIYNQSIPGLDTPIPARTWSDVQGYIGFKQGLYPMPMVMADEVVPPKIQLHRIISPCSNEEFKINPFKYGAWSG